MLKKNSLFGIDLQTLLQSEPLPVVGKPYFGILKCKTPSEGCLFGNEFVFEEVKVSPTVVRRNLCAYDGKHITATRRLTDGKPRLNFKNLHLDGAFNIDHYAIEVMNEIREALKCFAEVK